MRLLARGNYETAEQNLPGCGAVLEEDIEVVSGQ